MQRYEKYGILNYLCKVILERMMKKNAIPTCENMVDDHVFDVMRNVMGEKLQSFSCGYANLL